jgi:poly(3-hydroxybutyrate) depolymerase
MHRSSCSYSSHKIKSNHLARLVPMIFLSSLLLLSTPGAWACSGLLDPKYNGEEKIIFTRPGLPKRAYRVFTPKGYNTRKPSKVVIAAHGWCGNGKEWTLDSTTQAQANKYNYIVVGLDGLGRNEGTCNSWSFQGSNTGLGPSGDITTCDTSLEKPNNCYQSCGECENRCSWTQCQDDDVQFVKDLIQGGVQDFKKNALSEIVCFDETQIFVMGSSNGGMFTWELLQDNRTASLFRAAAPMIGTPHCGYDIGGSEQVPVISLTSKNDMTVAPSNLPWPGQPTDVCITNRDGEGYKFVSSHRITSVWAKAGGCTVDKTAFPTRTYDSGSKKLECFTWCNGSAPYTVDCYFEAGHSTPGYVIESAFDFFQSHSTCSKKSKRCSKRGKKSCCTGTCVNKRCT